ncbi:septum formation initiator family protein [Alphaproteobacteria bacterium]|jgi:cell division protein FtsB|nr:septum formation initiator family protein [Alphaproteobacteria bacterium]
MIVLREIRRRARHILPAAICAVVVGYFSYHALQGEKGIHSYLKVKREFRDAHRSLNTVQSFRLELENRVKGLRDTSLDLDLLEERARVVLNLMRDDELLIYFPRD